MEIIPISGDEEIESFLKRYSVLNKIEFQLVNPNDEIDGEKIFGSIREYLKPLHPESTKIETRSAEGLNVDQALDRIQAATATANQKVKLTGKDKDGNKLKGDNHQFQIGAIIDPIPATRDGLTEKLFKVFEEFKNSGAIKIGQQSEAVSRKIRNLIRLL